MKSLNQVSCLFSTAEKLQKNQFLALKGGDDKRPPRPGGGTIDPNPQPNQQVGNNNQQN